MSWDEAEEQSRKLRLEKVNRLKKLIAEGKYTVSAEQLAEAMLRQHDRQRDDHQTTDRERPTTKRESY